MDTILLIPVGHIDDTVLEPLARILGETFDVSCEKSKKMELPPEAFNVERSQFLATAILAAMPSPQSGSTTKKLGVTDVDLYAADLNFVFGSADPARAVAIISLCRLREEFYGLKCDVDLFHSRIAKEAIHELGHSLGLSHCRNARCVMFFSNTLLDTDRKGKEFCPDCRRQLPV